MNIVRRIPYFSSALVLGAGLCVGSVHSAMADPPASTASADSTSPSSDDAQNSLPQEGLISSLKQAFNKNFDHEVVRGHFEVGSAPNVHRYYCLADAKTGKREPNGVLGQPTPRADGMTGIKDSSVSLYRCNDAEKQGLLVTAGYVLKGGAAAAVPASMSASAPVSPAYTASPVSSDRVDVAGVKLGMSPDEVCAVLKAKKLSDFRESAQALDRVGSAGGAAQPIPGGLFVNVMSAWSGGDEGESYEVMFTPVPGKERAMAIVHTVGYSSANGVREMALENALIAKYHGFATPNDLPASPTWRIQNGGNVQVGDTCNRRGIFGGVGEVNVRNANRQNLALKTTAEEFRFQLDHCGLAIITEDHSTTSGASREDRMITRFTVTAYSPSLASEGAVAARSIETADAATKAGAPRSKEPSAPNL